MRNVVLTLGGGLVFLALILLSLLILLGCIRAF
jgi:hypothetical protein